MATQRFLWTCFCRCISLCACSVPRWVLTLNFGTKRVNSWCQLLSVDAGEMIRNGPQMLSLCCRNRKANTMSTTATGGLLCLCEQHPENRKSWRACEAHSMHLPAGDSWLKSLHFHLFFFFLAFGVVRLKKCKELANQLFRGVKCHMTNSLKCSSTCKKPETGDPLKDAGAKRLPFRCFIASRKQWWSQLNIPQSVLEECGEWNLLAPRPLSHLC